MKGFSNICYKCFVCTRRTLFPDHWAPSGKSKVIPRIWKYFQKANTLIAIENQNMKRWINIWTGKQSGIKSDSCRTLTFLWFQHFSFWSRTCCSRECEESLFIRGQIWRNCTTFNWSCCQKQPVTRPKGKICYAVTKVLRTSDIQRCQSGFLALTYSYTNINILLVLSQSEITVISHSCIGK